jgi:hypothetical protein
MDRVVKLEVEFHARKIGELKRLEDAVQRKVKKWAETHTFKEIK